MADHRFAHRADRAVERGQHPVGADADLVVVGVEALGDDVGVLELVTLRRRRRIRSRWRTSSARAGRPRRADRRSGWSRHRRDSRQPTGTSATSRRSTASRSEARTASSQSRSDQSARSACRVKSGAQYVVVVRRPSGSIATSVAGGILATPRRIVSGGGTTEWKREVVVQGDRIDAGVDAAAGQQRGQRRREPDAVRVLGDVERFDAEPVAPEQHPAAVPLDDREGEHPVQPVDEAVAPVVVGLQQHLGVARWRRTGSRVRSARRAGSS